MLALIPRYCSFIHSYTSCIIVFSSSIMSAANHLQCYISIGREIEKGIITIGPYHDHNQRISSNIDQHAKVSIRSLSLTLLSLAYTPSSELLRSQNIAVLLVRRNFYLIRIPKSIVIFNKNITVGVDITYHIAYLAPRKLRAVGNWLSMPLPQQQTTPARGQFRKYLLLAVLYVVCKEVGFIVDI